MQRPPTTRRKYSLVIWSVFLLSWAGLLWRLRMPHPGLQASGVVTWIEMLFLLLLYGYILLTTYGLGHLFLRLFKLPLLSKAESSLLAFLTGLGIFAIGLTFLGMLGWLNTLGILIWLAIAGFIAFRELLEVMHDRATNVDASASVPRSRFEVLLQTMALACILLQLVSVVSPVWDYDALMYHMEIPRQFLIESRIYFNPEVWRSAYPFLGEMPFLVGIIFGLDSLGKLINLTYAVLLISSVYVFSVRFLGRRIAYTASAILIGAPAFLLWASWASIDYAWACYEFWSIYAVCLWLIDGDPTRRKWLVLAGLIAGAAASTKYLSLPTLLIVTAIVAGKSIENFKQPAKEVATDLLIFGTFAGLVMGVWYLKNWLWTGNPIYPLVFGGLGWDPLEKQVLNDYVQTFGVGKTWLDYLLLPFNVYAYHDRFATIPAEVIHPALWLGFLAPIVVKRNKIFSVILVYTAVYFVSWVVTSQVVRLLLPLTAFAAILAGSVIEGCPVILKNMVKFGLLGGLIILNIIQQIGTIQNIGIWDYFLGQKSAAQVVQKTNNDFDTISYIQSSLMSSERVLFLWDGRGYYCDKRCIPDDEQSTAIRLSVDSPVPQVLAQDLEKTGVTHIMLSKPDASWFIAYHDPRGLHRKAYDYFLKTFLPACGKSIFQDEGMTLFELTCH